MLLGGEDQNLVRTYAFKSWALADALRHVSAHVLWVDANVELRRPLDGVRARLQRDGHFLTRQLFPFPNPHFHRTSVVRALGCRAPPWSRPQCWAGVQGYANASWAARRVLAPTLACVLDPSCVAPPGANRSNHRQDQTVLNAVACALEEAGARAREEAPRGGGRFPLCTPDERFWADLGSDFRERKRREGTLAALTPTADEPVSVRVFVVVVCVVSLCVSLEKISRETCPLLVPTQLCRADFFPDASPRTDWNDVVLLCRREHPVKPYIKHIRWAETTG